MELKYYSKNTSFTEAMKESAEKKFEKLQKFLKEDEAIKITLESLPKEKLKVKAQIVLKNNKRCRYEVVSEDYYDAIVDIVDNLKQQAKANKISYKERLVKTELDDIEVAEPKVAKIKRFKIEPMTEGMAMLEMSKLGHDSFLFKNINESDKVSMLYSRMDGDYGLIVIDEEE